MSFKTFAPSLKKTKILAQKRPILALNMQFLSFWAKYWPFWSILYLARQKTMQKRCIGAPSKLIRMFGQKSFFPPKYAFLGTYRRCRLIWCPVDWLVDGSGCGAWAVSRKTPIYFIYLMPKTNYNLPLLFQS